MRRKFLTFWGYIIELLLACATYVLLCYWVSPEELSSFWRKTWIAWCSVCGIVLAAAVTMLIQVVQLLTSEFGGYLTSRSVDSTFKRAYGFAVLVSFFGIVSFVLAGNISSSWLAHAAGMFLMLMSINLYTMIKNLFNLQRMNALFEKLRRRQEQS